MKGIKLLLIILLRTSIKIIVPTVIFFSLGTEASAQQHQHGSAFIDGKPSGCPAKQNKSHKQKNKKKPHKHHRIKSKNDEFIQRMVLINIGLLLLLIFRNKDVKQHLPEITEDIEYIYVICKLMIILYDAYETFQHFFHFGSQ